MPKYVVTAGGDEFFLPDDSHYYYNEMKGPTYLRYDASIQTYSNFFYLFTMVVTSWGTGHLSPTFCESGWDYSLPLFLNPCENGLHMFDVIAFNTTDSMK